MPDRSSKTTTEAAAKAERYEQELSRSLGLWGNVALCVAAITPAVGVFAIAPILLNMAGTGAVWALVVAGFLGLSMAACYGSLAAPIRSPVEIIPSCPGHSGTRQALCP